MRFKIRNLILLVLALLILAALFGSGVLDWNRLRVRASQGTRNVASDLFTAPGGQPGPVSGNAASSAAGCRDMLRRIETAKRSVSSKSGISIGSPSWDDVLREMRLRTIPRCKGGGSYILGTYQESARCSIGGNGTNERADDHILTGF
jgi:hypothetical protein